MKQIALLIAIAIPNMAWPQAPSQPAPAASQARLPEAPSPAGTSSMWSRIEHLPRGEKIKISYGSGPWDRCRFAGATDAYLFCEPGEDWGQAQEYRIDRAGIADFKIDHDERNGRLIFAGVTLGAGVALGIRCAQNQVYQSDAEAVGSLCGLLGVGLGSVVAMPLSCLSGYCVTFHLPPPQPMAYGIGFNVPLRRVPLLQRR